jgi:hypothetical protein
VGQLRALHPQGTPRDTDEDRNGGDERHQRKEGSGVFEDEATEHGIFLDAGCGTIQRAAAFAGATVSNFPSF